MTEPLNIAVIGSGYWGPNLIRNVAQSPNATLHTVCDLDEAKLAKMKVQHNPLHITTDTDAMLANDEIDAVIVATPAEAHAEVARKVLEAGKHALVEKPLTLNSAESQMLVDLAAKRNLILMVGHVFLYNPAVITLKDLVDSGELGDVFYVYSTRVNLGKIRTDLNAFWNLAPHDISIINHILGNAPKQVSAHGYVYLQPELGLEDVVFAVLEYEGGIAAHIHTSWLDPNKIRRTTVVGEKKMVVYDDVSANRITIYDKGAAWVDSTSHYGIHRLQTYTGDIHIPKLPAQEPLRAEIEHFLDCVRTGQKPLSDGVDGLNVVKVLEAASESLKNGGHPVKL